MFSSSVTTHRCLETEREKVLLVFKGENIPSRKALRSSNYTGWLAQSLQWFFLPYINNYVRCTNAGCSCTAHCRQHPARTRSLPGRLLEAISSPPTPSSHLPCRCVNMKKATQAPRTLWSNAFVVGAFVWQYHSLHCLSHAQTAGSNSDPHDTIQSLLCLAFWFLIDTFTARRDKCCWEDNVHLLRLFLWRTFLE